MELDPVRWARIEAVFADAAEMAPGDRLSFLDRACCDDTGAPDLALRDEVLALLRLDDEATAFFEDGLQKVVAPSPPAAEPGERVGPWRLVREVGRGGMGAVWLAERADGDFRQRAAIKVVRRGLGEDAIERFRAERQILADLDHPHIAKLLDGGVTDDGRPYLALEFIEGEPITDYADRHRLGINDRLVLFAEVAHAVGYAHQNLVVHRDLKPSNVLVARGPDGRARPTLLDFGIAKLLDESEPDLDQTRTGTWLLTPDYAAPEQVSGGAITTATDVYGLGVVLYQLLAGRRPVRVGRGSPAEIERAIVEGVPLRPSDAAGSPEDRPSAPGGELASGGAPSGDGAAPDDDRSPEAVARRRGLAPAALRRRLRGDLDRIALKALRKEPGRRYHSAEALARDVERHLEGLPVEARPDTVGYRFRKFARRHRAVVWASGVVLLAIVAVASVATWAAREAARERDRALASSQMLIDVFGDVDPDQTGGREVSALALLDLTSERMRTGLRGDDRTRAAMEAAMGKVYGNLGEFERAEALQRSALETRRRLFSPGHPDVLQSLADLALLLARQSRYDEAERLLDGALDEAERELQPAHPATGAIRHAIGVNLTEQGRFAEAEPHLLRALRIRNRTLGDTAAAVAHSTAALGGLYRRQGRLDEAEALYRTAADRYRALFGDDNPRLGSALNEIGVIRKNGGDYRGAEPFYRQALAIFEAAYGQRHPEYALALSNLGLLLKDRAILIGGSRSASGAALLDEAEPMLMRSLDIYRDLHGDSHLRVAHTEAHVGHLHLARGHGRQAEQWFRQSLATHDRAETPALHTARPYPLTGLGEALLLRGRASDAEAPLREALAVREQATPGHWRIAEAQSALSE
ncbi:MAG: tetratricopeptide repeat protein, partial [Bacteroidota bacterium]